MSAADAVLAGRLEAESLMVDACMVTRPADPATDPETGEVSAGFTMPYYGPCKVQKTMSQASNPTSGGHSFTVQDSRIDFPVDAGPLTVNDSVTITASALDPQLVDRVFRVVEVFHKSFATAQRTRVEEVVA